MECLEAQKFGKGHIQNIKKFNSLKIKLNLMKSRPIPNKLSQMQIKSHGKNSTTAKIPLHKTKETSAVILGLWLTQKLYALFLQK